MKNVRKVMFAATLVFIVVASVIVNAQNKPADDSEINVHLEVNRDVIDGEGRYYFSFVGDDLYAKALKPFSFTLTDAELAELQKYVNQLVQAKAKIGEKMMWITEDYAHFKENGWGITLTMVDSKPDREWMSGEEALVNIKQFDEQIKN